LRLILPDAYSGFAAQISLQFHLHQYTREFLFRLKALRFHFLYLLLTEDEAAEYNCLILFLICGYLRVQKFHSLHFSGGVGGLRFRRFFKKAFNAVANTF